MLRSLIHFRRINLAVILGAAITCAVTTGALLTGDSVRGSLRDLALGRLGRIDTAVMSDMPMGQKLAASLPAGSAPAILMRGAVVDAATSRRASRVNVIGVDGAFWSLFGTEAPAGLVAGAAPAQVAINAALRRELGPGSGGEPQALGTLVITFPRPAEAPVDSVLGRRDLSATLGTLRAIVAAVLPDEGPGAFTLQMQQTLPLNVYVPLADLQRTLRMPDKINLLLASRGEAAQGDVARSLTMALDLEDLGLRVSRDPSHLRVESRRFVMTEETAGLVETAAVAAGGVTQRAATYLANAITSARGRVPYSTITALGPADPPFPTLHLEGGGPALVGEGEILISTWAQEDLRVARGDAVEVDYFVMGDREQLIESRMKLRVAGVVAMDDVSTDASLTPDYPGIGDATDIASWDPPFPVDLSRIRPRDEAYWDAHRAAPKAFVSWETAQRRWASRHGLVTSVRVMSRTRIDPEVFAAQLRDSIRRQMPLERAGIALRDLRQEALAAAQGATDFGALFFGFSMFLIVSSAMLCGLMFRLGVEQRATEAGLLLALGYPARRVRRRFLAEGMVLASLGCAAGLTAGMGYAWLLMLGLRTIWLPAVGTSHLFLHVTPRALAAGAAVSLLAVALAILWSVRRIARVPAARLLAGSTVAARRAGGGAAGLVAGCIGLAGSLSLAGAAAATGTAQAAMAFGAGACALIAALGFFGWWCARGRHRALRPTPGVWAGMAARNCGHRPARSVLSAALIACASFVIVTVAASRQDKLGGHAGPEGAVGYNLMAESDIPLHHDPATPEGRFELGMQPSAEALFAGVEIASLRLVPGEDVSCLNLYAPTKPRLLGVPARTLRPEGFSFSASESATGNPWELLESDLGPGVVPAIGDANSVLWILHLGLGKELVLTDDAGAPMRLRFVALMAGSPFQGEILIADKHMGARFPSRSGRSFFLIAAPPARAGELTQALEIALAPQGFDVVSVAERIASYHAVENTYLSTFQVLGGLGLLLGTVGLAVVMVRSVIERRGELATMAAVGFTRARLARLILAENGFLLGVGLLAGCGAALAAVAPRLAGAGGAAPWLSLSLTLLAVLATGMLAGVVAVRGALAGPLLPLLKSER